MTSTTTYSVTHPTHTTTNATTTTETTTESSTTFEYTTTTTIATTTYTSDFVTGPTAEPTAGPTAGPDCPECQLPSGVQCKKNKFSRALKIVGGEESRSNSWPWIARLQIEGKWRCGGSIINENWILSAAHCCEAATTNSSIEVYVGDHDTETTESHERSYISEQIEMHVDYASNHPDKTLGYDFCLIKTAEKIDLDGNSRDIVCLPEQGDRVESGSNLGENCFVAGWGTLAAGGNVSPSLQTVDVDIINGAECNNNYGGSIDLNSEICAGKLEGGKDACQGDSGGPLVCIDQNNQPILHGVVSWGSGCASAGYPGVYGDVSSIIEWMDELIGVESAGTNSLLTIDYYILYVTYSIVYTISIYKNKLKICDKLCLMQNIYIHSYI